MNPGDGTETEDLRRPRLAISHVSSMMRHLDLGILFPRQFRTYVLAATVILLFVLAPHAKAQTRIDLDQAIQLALIHNHALQAERTLVLQNQAQEITANLRPNPTLDADTQYFPIFTPQDFTAGYLDTNQEFDLGIGYLFERGNKRQRRLKAAQDQTAVTRAQVQDAERTLTFNVAQEFIAVLLAESTLQFSEQNLKDFQQTVDLAQTQYKSGYISEGDYLKIELQLLQFQTDVSASRLAKVQSLVALRQSLSYDAVPADYDVIGDLSYAPVKEQLEDLEIEALKDRPDLRASELGIASAQSQIMLAKANGKQDVSGGLTYTHTSGANSSGISLSIPWALFDRNQGEIARTQHALTQAQQTEIAASDQVLSDLNDAYNLLRSNDEVVHLYTSGYLKQAQDSRDISQYAYKRGAASLLDFLDAERSYRTVQLAYRQALSSYMTSLEQLKEAVGTRNLP